MLFTKNLIAVLEGLILDTCNGSGVFRCAFLFLDVLCVFLLAAVSGCRLLFGRLFWIGFSRQSIFVVARFLSDAPLREVVHKLVV